MQRGRKQKFKSKFQPSLRLRLTGKFKSKSFIQSFIHSVSLSLILSIWFLIITGCSEDKIIEQDKLVLVYSDLLIAQDTVSLDEKGVDSLRQSVFQKYNITEKEYETTIEYYNEDLERWEEFFDKVTAHIGSLKTKVD